MACLLVLIINTKVWIRTNEGNNNKQASVINDSSYQLLGRYKIAMRPVYLSTKRRGCIWIALIASFPIIRYFSGIELCPLPFPSSVQPEESGLGYLGHLIAKCGDLCTVEGGMFRESLQFDKRTVSVDCSAIFSDEVFIMRGHGQENSPRELPHNYVQDFTMNGKIPVRARYFDQMYLSKTAETPVWKKETVDQWVALAKNETLEGTYGVQETNHLQNALRFANGVRGGRVLVIGSENPWVESVVLAAGARDVITLEYGKIFSGHPKIKTMTPEVFKREYNAGSLGLFDAVVTFSSVEHSGLGRYGDALNPWGDVLEIARAHCVCKEKGSLTIAVMTNDASDAIEFNAHRIYGKIRWPYLASNWQLIHREPDGEQLVHVFLKE